MVQTGIPRMTLMSISVGREDSERNVTAWQQNQNVWVRFTTLPTLFSIVS